MELKSSFAIESRVQLIAALAEAAEIEHNLMCLYLYAMFSLKRSETEGVSARELEAINRWRKVILSIALEEMNHLTLVSNLMSSLGVSPHFMRPNFPTAPGYYPADMIVELARFDMSTLDHFIFLERPRSQELKDGETFDHSLTYTRLSEKGRLMPTSGDYHTVGALYLSIREAIESLCTRSEEANLFCGSKTQQIGPMDASLPGLTLITSKQEALQAIDTIITQGEGGGDDEDSHFCRFLGIKKEYELLLKENPNFVPARAVARNPVMRKPIDSKNRVWITEPLAAKYLDLANTLYSMMLRLLVQVYALDGRPSESKSVLLNASFNLMHAMATVAETLTHLPVSENQNDIFSGMSFAMVRTLAPLERISEKKLICERFNEVVESIKHLQSDIEREGMEDPLVGACASQLGKTVELLSRTREEIASMPDGFEGADSKIPKPLPAVTSEATKSPAQVPVEAGPQIEISETDKIQLRFDSKRCIHSRHCVTELPTVFKANTPGKWIFAENTEPEILAAVARECPSGAIQYTRKDGVADEAAPQVNIMRIRENGPYAFLADLNVDGKPIGMRATLCRCGKSANKPFCDGTHNSVKFAATGEPFTIDDTALASRDGMLSINRTPNGPLAVTGNVEICAGTGRVVLRTKTVRLCRCGNSKTKPVCDGSHTAAGFTDDPSQSL